MKNEALSRFDLPGYNLPLNQFSSGRSSAHGHNGLAFPSGIDPGMLGPRGKATIPLTTLREFEMLRVMNRITDKKGWESKVFDESITNKWKHEALSNTEVDITAKMIEWIVDELRWKAEEFKLQKMVTIFEGNVIKSDDAVSVDLKTKLKHAAHILQRVPEADKDWHPGSEGKVLDLVHPSLFPLVYGRTRILSDDLVPLHTCKHKIGEGEKLEIPPLEDSILEVEGSESDIDGYNSQYGYESDIGYSRTFQWLPCEVELVSDSDYPWKITSYINNLDFDKHPDIYLLIEQTISEAIPLWNKTLEPFDGMPKARKPLRISYSSVEYDCDPYKDKKHDKPRREHEETTQDYAIRLKKWFRANRELILPEPGKFKPPSSTGPGYERMGLRERYGSTGLQIIVKLASIHLTPEQPEYEGGTWHLEGQLNEQICATAIYYYDVNNITDSYLSFRQIVDFQAFDVHYPQDDHAWLEKVFGCKQSGPQVQIIGSVLCKEGRLVTFPNVLQHRVEPFRLLDPSKPGHRKILALFLVDPNCKIISTANVPPQRRDWWLEAVTSDRNVWINQLPGELHKQIFSYLDHGDFPINIDEAKRLREELMEERKAFVEAKNNEIKGRSFSLCEH